MTQKKNTRRRKLLYLVYLWLVTLFDPLRWIKFFPALFKYIGDWKRYKKMPGAEKLRLIDSHPCLYDHSSLTPIDKHYFYQDRWAFKKIVTTNPSVHIDVGSMHQFVSFLTTFTKVTFVDIRPLDAKLENLTQIKGSVLNLPFSDGSIESLSCLHVAEHIGLARYGDNLDPLGTKKACAELARVLKPGGQLYFSLPVGIPRVCFNAHRIHSVTQILDYFSNLKLVELSGVTDSGEFVQNINQDVLNQARYACGLFVFTKN